MLICYGACGRPEILSTTNIHFSPRPPQWIPAVVVNTGAESESPAVGATRTGIGLLLYSSRQRGMVSRSLALLHARKDDLLSARRPEPIISPSRPPSTPLLSALNSAMLRNNLFWLAIKDKYGEKMWDVWDKVAGVAGGQNHTFMQLFPPRCNVHTLN